MHERHRDNGDDDDGREPQGRRKSPTDPEVVRDATRARLSGLEVRIALRLEVPNDTLTSKGFGEGSAGLAEDSEKQNWCSIPV